MKGRLEIDIKKEESTQKVLDKLPEFVSEWQMNLKASGKTASTRYDYAYKIKNFIGFINSKAPKEVTLEDITFNVVQKFIISIQTKKDKDGNLVETSDSYRCTYWAMLRNFFDYLLGRKLISEDPMGTIKCPKNRDLDRINKHRSLLTSDDFKDILNAVDKDTDNIFHSMYESKYNFELRERNKFLLMLLMTTGMRETALTEINVEDVDVHAAKIIIVDKGQKEHIYDLSEEVNSQLGMWLVCRQEILDGIKKESDALFISIYGERIGVNTVKRVVTKYSEAGLGYKISPHKLRSGYASILYSKSHDIEYVRKAIGHSDVATTQRYIVTEGNEKKTAADMITKAIFD